VRENPGRILIVRGGAIGDFVLTLPVLAALRSQLPGARIEVLGYPHIAGLALLGGLAHEVHSIEARALAGFFARGGDLDATLAARLAGFAIIISYLYDPDGVFRENVGRCSKAQFIAGRHRPDEALDRHATEVFLQPLEQLAIFDPDPVPRLALNPKTGVGRSAVRLACPTSVFGLNKPGGSALALHPGSGSETKNWPEARWRELIEHLLQRCDQRLLLVGGEAEGGRLDRLAAGLPTDRVETARNLPLTELAGRLADCAGFVGHDSGITHLAAAVGLPGLALWGGTREPVWRPRSDGIRIVRASGGLASLTVADVLAGLDAAGLGNPPA